MCKLFDSAILFMRIQPKVVMEHVNNDEYINKVATAALCIIVNLTAEKEGSG